MKETYWVCSYSATYAGRAKVLESSVKKHTAHTFVRSPVPAGEAGATPIELLVVRDRLSRAAELLRRGAYEVIVSGADYCVYAPLTELVHEYESYGAVFCPHTVVLPKDAWSMMRGGAINSDFQVWRNHPGVVEFLDSLLRNLAAATPSNIFEYEQHWLPFALAQCNGKLITHPGYGMAFYNLHERSLGIHERVLSGAAPAGYLKTFHFTGMDFFDGAKVLSRHSSSDMRPLTQYEHTLIQEYRKKVLAST